MVSLFWEWNDKEFLKCHILQSHFFKSLGILIIIFHINELLMGRRIPVSNLAYLLLPALSYAF